MVFTKSLTNYENFVSGQDLLVDIFRSSYRNFKFLDKAIMTSKYSLIIVI